MKMKGSYLGIGALIGAVCGLIHHNRKKHAKDIEEHLLDGAKERKEMEELYHLVPHKDGCPVVGVDLDEVLGHFIPALCDFHNATHGTALQLEDFHSYTFHEVWGGTAEESVHRVHAFFDSHYFENMSPVEGAYETLKHFVDSINFVVVTSRQHTIYEDTLIWLQKHFPNIFCDIRFGNHWGLSGPSVSKPEMCKDIGACMLIDDNVKYALQCSEIDDFQCILFDWKNSYRWSDCDAEKLPHNVDRVNNWDRVHKAIEALCDV